MGYITKDNDTELTLKNSLELPYRTKEPPKLKPELIVTLVLTADSKTDKPPKMTTHRAVARIALQGAEVQNRIQSTVRSHCRQS